MGKNWLIRTKSNHILGPVSKEKVLELYHNNSIKLDDEVCTGNGYWFFIRETELVEKYLLGNEVQGFNPMSEAKDVLTLGIDKVPTERTRDDITLIGSLDLSALKQAKSQSGPVEAQTHVAQPLNTEAPAEVKKKVKTEVKPAPSENHSPKKNPKKQNYLKYLGIIGFLILFLLIYYRKAIIQSIFHGEISRIELQLIPTANAQDEVVKKKVF